MIYKDFQNLRLPMLGFGSMRLPLLPGGGDGDVDEAAVAEMVALAMERGANYFDTAYGYHNGNSERVMGRVLSRYPRESWLLASKFPGYDVSNIRPDRVEAIFEEQLEKCGVDYFDFYLFHNVYERNVGPYLDPDNRVLEYLLRQKEAGRIRHLGFSAHGSLAVIQRFLDAYGEYMEFGQLQLNYLDWDFQGARAKAEELNRRHIPIWVMEPLRGGRLARLSDGDAARLRDYFAPDEVDQMYINFCDPWPSNRHAKRRLTHGNFLRLYRQVLKMGGQIHFKTDNQDLFTFSVEELPLFGFELSEVTRDLHANGPVGVMTDYEAKFHEQGLPICRCVATMVPWEEPFPTDIRRVKNRWLDVFADGVSDAELGRHVLSDGNYLWHLFSWNLVPCLSGDAARQALSEASGKKYLFYYEEPPEGEPLVRPVTAEELVTLPADARAIPGADWYVVDKDFTWTFAQTHEADCGPYFCRKA